MSSISETTQYRNLWHAVSNKRLPHALMFVGVKGLRKTEHADYFSRALLCKKVSDEGVPCDDCHDCRLVVARTHPDLQWVQPEKEGAAIKIEQVRLVSEFVQQTSFSGSQRVVIISSADSLNVNASNALLKTLEEPSSGTCLILINDQNGRLPATIFSRCQKILFSEKSYEHRALLFMQDDERTKIFQTFIQAVDEKKDHIKLAANIAKTEVLLFLDYALAFVTDLMKVQLSSAAVTLLNRDYEDEFIKLKNHKDASENAELMTYIQKMRAMSSQGINLNKQLVFESILSRWGKK